MSNLSYYIKKRQPVPHIPLPLPPDFSKILRDLRKEGLSLEGMARECECSRELLYNLMEGNTPEPRYSVAEKLMEMWRLVFGKRLVPQRVRGTI